jgi:uncharacterized protein
MTDQADNPQNETATAAAPEARAAEAPANVNLVALVTDVVKYLVDSPDEVSVEEFKEGRNNIVLELMVAQKDVGKVIGKQGRTIRSLRNLLDAAASKLNVRATLEIIEDEDDDGDDQGSDDQGGPGNDNEAPDENFGNR